MPIDKNGSLSLMGSNNESRFLFLSYNTNEIYLPKQLQDSGPRNVLHSYDSKKYSYFLLIKLVWAKVFIFLPSLTNTYSSLIRASEIICKARFGLNSFKRAENGILIFRKKTFFKVPRNRLEIQSCHYDK